MPNRDLPNWRPGKEVSAAELQKIKNAILSLLIGGKGIRVFSQGAQLIIENAATLPDRAQFPLLYKATSNSAGGTVDIKPVESDGTTLVGNQLTVSVVI